MSRLNHTTFSFSIEAPGALTLRIDHPTPNDLPKRIEYSDAAITALLTAPQRTALLTLLGNLFDRVEQDIKSLLDAQRAAMNTDP